MKKSCGNCVFLLPWDDTHPVGYCYRHQKGDFPVKFDDSCRHWLDGKMRYSTELKNITDPKTLDWLHVAINAAYRQRFALKDEDFDFNSIIDKFEKLQQENKQLRAALRKCSPFTLDDIENGEGEVNTYLICVFCEDWMRRGRHADNCEYIKLTKEE